MLSDLKFAVRTLLKSPGFTGLAVLTLALGLGLNTAMFSMLNGFLLRPLSLPQAERLFRLDRNSPQRPFGNHAPANFDEIVSASSGVAELTAFRFWGFTLTQPDQPADTPLSVRVLPNYFAVLGQQPALGRFFSPEENEPGKNNVIVISQRYWRNRFGGDPAIIGRTVRLDGTTVTIVGVMPQDGDTTRILAPIALFRPLGLSDQERVSRTDASLGVIARLRDGVSPEQAATQFAAIGARLAADHPAENTSLALGLRPLQTTTLNGTGRNMTFILVGLSGFVLLIACANLANLLLARALSRSREFSIRAALGATRIQLIKPVAVECIVLAAAGGAAASLVSVWTCSWLSTRFGSVDNPVDFSTDSRVLAFTISTAVCTALFFGVAPAWWASRVRLNDAMKSGARGSTGNRHQNRFRSLLIVVQFALSLVLLTGAGLFLRGLERLIKSDNGWNPAPVVSGTVNLASTRYSAAAPIIAFHTQLRERLLSQPGVANVAVSFSTPIFNPPATRNYLVAGRPAPRTGEEIAAHTNGVSATFLDTFGLHLLRGRFFDDTDQVDSRPVVVINETMARTLFPDADAVGQRIAVTASEPQWAEIVGIVRDTRPLNIAPSPIRFQVYRPFTQEAWQYVTVSVRATDPRLAATLLKPIREAVAALDPDQPIFNLNTVPQSITNNFGVWETIMRLLVAFAALGLLLAAIGIYGVITRLVLQRTGEIGIRMALGANRSSILGLVLGDGLRTALIGIALGTVGAYFFARFLTRALPAFGGSAWVPALVGGGLLFLTAGLACFLPARRATKVDPMVALRAE
jgi:putative ABC transport system permease protein